MLFNISSFGQIWLPSIVHPWRNSMWWKNFYENANWFPIVICHLRLTSFEGRFIYYMASEYLLLRADIFIFNASMHSRRRKITNVEHFVIAPWEIGLVFIFPPVVVLVVTFLAASIRLFLGSALHCFSCSFCPRVPFPQLIHLQPSPRSSAPRFLHPAAHVLQPELACLVLLFSPAVLPDFPRRAPSTHSWWLQPV